MVKEDRHEYPSDEVVAYQLALSLSLSVNTSELHLPLSHQGSIVLVCEEKHKVSIRWTRHNDLDGDGWL